MKNLLIISPHFPPVNAADMHRVRQSLPYFQALGWKSTVVVTNPQDVETSQDALLLETIPKEIEVVQVRAFSTKYTRKLGLGSLALRSMWFYYREVSRMLKKRKFDLIYFSTTMFPIPILGRVWKKKFGVPYVIDMQDPWFSDYYLSRPKNERPPKFWFSYNLNKYTEPLAMKKADGIIAVSEAYNKTLQERYENITTEKCITLTFGAFEKDFEVLDRKEVQNHLFDTKDGLIHIPYIGRAGHDMKFALMAIFKALKMGLEEQSALFQKVRLYYIGTSYAADGKGKQTVTPLAQKMGVAEYVIENTNRIPYFEALRLLKDANMLMIPGSDDPKYTASKLYNYILAQKPMLALFHKKSSVISILKNTNAGLTVEFDEEDIEEKIAQRVYHLWLNLLQNASDKSFINWEAFAPYMAKEMTAKQVEHFNSIIN